MFPTFEKIKELAKKQEKSLGQVEKDLEYGRNTLYKIKNSTPNAERISEIASYFHVSTDYLLGRTDNPAIAGEPEKFYFEGQVVDVEQLASTAMRFNSKPLTYEDKKAIQNIIEIYLSKQ